MPSTAQRSKRRKSNETALAKRLQREFSARGITGVAELSLRADSVNEEERSVRAIVATDRPVLVPDWERMEMVDEILVIDGMQAAPAIPLLDNHRRWSLDDQIGGVDQIQPSSQRGEVDARLRFSDFGTDDDMGRRQERNWQRVKEGFARSVSAGYRAIDATYIRSGESAVIGGKKYTAGKRTLKVTTSWMLREVSLVPIGADPSAVIRAFHGGAKMPQETQTSPEGTRGDQPAAAPVQVQPQKPPQAQAPSVDADAVRAEAAVAERSRLAAIDQVFAGEDRPELRTRAINEGWTAERAAHELLTAIRANRGNIVERGAPAVHSTSHEARCTVDALAFAMAGRMGCQFDNPTFGQRKWRSALKGAFALDVNDPIRQEAMDNADQFASWSLVDIAREAIRLNGGTVPHDRMEIIERAFSTAELGDIFSNSISASVLVGYAESPDSTVGWTSEAEVPNFLTNERNAMGKFGRLKQLKAGGTAEDLDIDASQETYKVKRYAGKFTVDEQDFINDALMAMEQVAPSDMGAAAAQLRPDLVYAIILANAALVDSVALFHANHSNLITSSALTTTTLGTAYQTLMKQRIESRPLNLRGRYLLVPADLKVTADNVSTSQRRADTTSGAGEDNVVSQYGITAVADDRLGAAGVTNPDGGAALTGSATTWYLTARPGENGAKTIEVGYIRGSGRAPRVRQSQLSQGQYGMGWDISLDIGAKALDFRSMVKATA